HRKLVQAAARTHRATGLTIAAHTGNGAAAREELQTLRTEGVAASAFVWVHAQSESNRRMHVEAAQLGAWVEFDGIGPRSVTQHLELVSNLRDHGLLDRVLVSHDAGWYHVGEPGGGNYRGYETVFTEFVPALRRAGFTATDVNQVLVENPAAAFTIRTRPL
ncbi:MAG: phosphotriesterase, partial [Verrucomicrobiota bacterium]